MITSFYSEEELKSIGFKSVGRNVSVSRNATIYNAENIVLGSNVRIDDFCVLSGGNKGIKIGSYIHISCHCCFFGQGGIELEDFATVSSRCAIYSISDDFLGYAISNPTVPIEFRKIKEGKVTLKRHVLIGTGSTILPGVTINEGVSVGAMSLVTKDLEEWSIYVGSPAKFLSRRRREILEMEKKLLNS